MSGYTKLFSSILMSSVWEEPVETRIVWVTMLALADQHGHVDGTVKSLARVARVSVDACQRAIDTFLGDDAEDRSGVENGRRIKIEQGGWILVNHAAYRARMTSDERRERDKLRKRNMRLSARSPQTSEIVRDVSQAEADQIRSEEEKHARESAAPVKGSGRNVGRLFLHRWQLDALIDTLGPLADGFGLDSWIESLNDSLAGKALPRNSWKWVQEQMHAEIARRNLPRVETKPANGTPSNEPGDCPHTPRCDAPGRWECVRLSQIAALKAAEGIQ